MKFTNFHKFDKELEKLSKKRFPSLKDDLETVKNFLSIYPTGFSSQITITDDTLNGRNPQIMEISGVNNCDSGRAYIIKHFRCKSLLGKGARSGIRVTYIYQSNKEEITFMEIYFKEDKDIEDKERIKEFIRSLEQV